MEIIMKTATFLFAAALTFSPALSSAPAHAVLTLCVSKSA
jgi:hypothetical protein